ncbi:unnamed protein product [Rotaria sp. Silwood1]|nr:unnamed protein product [Rotaria sp. Silwood1]
MNQVPPSTSQQTMYMPNSSTIDNQMISTPITMNSSQLNLFNHQISAYKYLIRNQPIPEQHLIVIKRNQQQYYPSKQLSNSSSSSSSPLIDSSRYKPSPINGNIPSRYYPPIPINYQNQSVPPIPSITDNVTNTNYSTTRINNHRLTLITKPIGIDVQDIINERDNRIQNNILIRINELEKVLQIITQDNHRTRIMIELKALKLLNFQRQLRSEIITCMRLDSNLETGTYPRLYKRPKQFGLREARATEKLEKQQKAEIDRKRRQKHQEYLTAILTVAREFKEYHKTIQLKTNKLARSIVSWHQNTEREQKKRTRKT